MIQLVWKLNEAAVVIVEPFLATKNVFLVRSIVFHKQKLPSTYIHVDRKNFNVCRLNLKAWMLITTIINARILNEQEEKKNHFSLYLIKQIHRFWNQEKWVVPFVNGFYDALRLFLCSISTEKEYFFCRRLNW